MAKTRPKTARPKGPATNVPKDPAALPVPAAEAISTLSELCLAESKCDFVYRGRRFELVYRPLSEQAREDVRLFEQRQPIPPKTGDGEAVELDVTDENYRREFSRHERAVRALRIYLSFPQVQERFPDLKNPADMRTALERAFDESVLQVLALQSERREGVDWRQVNFS